MSADIKFIVGELNKPPYSRNYNIISFDSLTPEQLLQVLNDVFAEIDSKNGVDIREEEPDHMAVRMLGMLRILKYKPPEENKNTFRAGLVAGQKHVIQPILLWLLQKMEELKKRAYLAKYLVKMEVPSDIKGDADMADLCQKYDDLIEQFKVVHREFEALKNSRFSTEELRRDIKSMEEERELVTKRIEKMKQRTDGTPKQEGMLESARQLRKEKENQKEMGQQEVDLKSTIQIQEQRIQRLDTQLKELRKASVGTTPEGLLKKLEEDLNVTSYIVNEKMPKELKVKENLVETLKKVLAEPAMGQNELEAIKKKISSANSEISSLNESRMKEVEDDDNLEGKVGKLSFFRQNASLISKKKEQTAERLGELKSELTHILEEIKERQDQLKEYSGEEVLRGDDFKLYINRLRGKSTNYKMKRAEISEMRAEFGILSRTQEILKAQEAHIEEQLASLEAQTGIVGFRDTQENLEKISSLKSQVDERKGQTLEDMSSMVRELNFKIAERKSNLAPLLKEVKPLREKMQSFSIDYNDKKSTYDSVAAGLESNMSKLEQEVKKLEDEILKIETKHHIDLAKKGILSYNLGQMNEEIQLYLSKDSQDKKKSLRDQLMTLISEQEKQGWILREEQKTVKDLVQTSAKQLHMWQDVVRLLESKTKCLQNARNGGQLMRNSGGEALVL